MPKKARGQSNKMGCMVQADYDSHQVMSTYDELRWQTRMAVANSPFQLCCDCVSDYGGNVEAVRTLERDIRAALAEHDKREDAAIKGWQTRRRELKLQEMESRIASWSKPSF